MIPVVASTPFFSIVPNGFGFLGSNIIFGRPPVADVFGLHAGIDSSINKYTVLSSARCLALNASTNGLKLSHGILSEYQNSAPGSKEKETHRQMCGSSEQEYTVHSQLET